MWETFLHMCTLGRELCALSLQSQSSHCDIIPNAKNSWSRSGIHHHHTLKIWQPWFTNTVMEVKRKRGFCSAALMFRFLWNWYKCIFSFPIVMGPFNLWDKGYSAHSLALPVQTGRQSGLLHQLLLHYHGDLTGWTPVSSPSLSFLHGGLWLCAHYGYHCAAHALYMILITISSGIGCKPISGLMSIFVHNVLFHGKIAVIFIQNMEENQVVKMSNQVPRVFQRWVGTWCYCCILNLGNLFTKQKSGFHCYKSLQSI